MGTALLALVGNLATTLVGEAIKKKLTGSKVASESIPPSKGLIQSKTSWGVVTMALPMVAGWFGLDLGVEAVQEIVSQVFVIGGGLFAIYGRLKAKTPIS